MQPPVRRMKAYTGSTGYVYQYYFVGERPALPNDPAAPATEFIFDVTADRKVTFAVSVFCQREALDAWAAAHGRALNQPEQYAAAKMRLFAAFDAIEHLQQDGRRLLVDATNIEELLGSLSLE